jgi:hypothetical protein
VLVAGRGERAAGEGEVEGAGVEVFVALGAEERCEPVVEGLLDLLLEDVDLLADGTPAVGRGRAELLQDGGELTLLAEDLGVLVAKRLLGRRGAEARRKLAPQRLERGEDGGGDVGGGGLGVGNGVGSCTRKRGVERAPGSPALRLRRARSASAGAQHL